MAVKKEVSEEVVEEVKVKPAKKVASKKVVEENEVAKPAKKTTAKKTAKTEEVVAEEKKVAKKTTAKKAAKTEEAVAEEKKVAKKATKTEEVVAEEKKPAKKTTAKKAVKEEEVVAEEKKVAKKAVTKKVPKDKTTQYWGTGRRKKSVARVRIMLGNGKFIINNRDIDEYFGLENLKVVAKQPLALTENVDKFDVFVNVYGGGFTGQSGAIRMGLARALEKFDANLRPSLKKAGYLTRDARVKERKKYGLLKARKDQPFVKR